jgi:di/tricarboxylate transporter
MSKSMSSQQTLAFAACIAVPVAIWFSPLGLEPQTHHGLAIVSFMVLAWITQVMEFAIAGLIGCFLFWALGVVRFNVAFGGFANDTPWFLFAALLLGRIASKSGIARRACLCGDAVRQYYLFKDSARSDRH